MRLLAVLLLALPGCQFFFPMPLESDAALHTPAEQPIAGRRSFEPGERWVASVSVETVSVGRATLEVGQPCRLDSRHLALPVAGAGEASGFLSFLSSSGATTQGLIDPETGFPTESRVVVSSSDRTLTSEFDFDGRSFRAHQMRETPSMKKPAHTRRRVTLPEGSIAHDGHSMLGFLRHWDAREGERGFLYVVIGRYFMRIDVVHSGIEPLSSNLGEKQAIRIDGVATRLSEKTLRQTAGFTPKPFTMWFTDDDAHIPLRIHAASEVAEMTVDLVEYVGASAPAQEASSPKPCERFDKSELSKIKPRPTEGEPAEPKKNGPRRIRRPAAKSSAPQPTAPEAPPVGQSP